MVKLPAVLRATFPRFISRKYKRRCANLGIFWNHPRAPSPAGFFFEIIFVADKLIFKDK